MGVQRRLEIASSGELIAEDLREGTRVTVTLAEDEVSRLAALLAENCPATPPLRPPACADCFEYAYTLDVDGLRMIGVENDISLRTSLLAPWIEALRDLWQQATDGELGGT